MLEMKDVSFNYGNGVPVLEHVNVQIGEGEFIGLGGRNGCGKTTVTRLLMGLEKPYPGKSCMTARSSTMTMLLCAAISWVTSSSGRNGRCSGRRSVKKWPTGRSSWA